MTLAQVKSLSASYGPAEFQGKQVPALAELAALLPEDVALALELKIDRFLNPAVCRRLVVVGGRWRATAHGRAFLFLAPRSGRCGRGA